MSHAPKKTSALIEASLGWLFVAAFFLVVAVAGIWVAQTLRNHFPGDRFQAITTAQGIVRMDRTTGELWLWVPKSNEWVHQAGSEGEPRTTILGDIRKWWIDRREPKVTQKYKIMPTFDTEIEMEQAAKRGEIKDGDSVMIAGRSGKYRSSP